MMRSPSPLRASAGRPTRKRVTSWSISSSHPPASGKKRRGASSDAALQLASIEDLFEPGFAAIRLSIAAAFPPLAIFTAFAKFAALPMTCVAGLRLMLRLLRGGALLHFLCRAFLDDLVELAAIEPDAAAFRAIVDLDVFTLGHDQVDLADRAQQAHGCGLVHQIHPMQNGQKLPCCVFGSSNILFILGSKSALSTRHAPQLRNQPTPF